MFLISLYCFEMGGFHYVAKLALNTGLELTILLPQPSQQLEFQACVTTPSLGTGFPLPKLPLLSEDPGASKGPGSAQFHQQDPGFLSFESIDVYRIQFEFSSQHCSLPHSTERSWGSRDFTSDTLPPRHRCLTMTTSPPLTTSKVSSSLMF